MAEQVPIDENDPRRIVLGQNIFVCRRIRLLAGGISRQTETFLCALSVSVVNQGL
jgi:hypothetical protein